MPRITLETAKQRVELVERFLREGHPPPGNPTNSSKGEKGAIRSAMLASGCSHTGRDWINSAQAVYRPVNWSLWKAGADPSPTIEPEAEPISSKERRRFLDKIDELQRQLKQADRQSNADDDLREALFNLTKQEIDPPQWTFDEHEAGQPGIPILFTSDFQVGERVRAQELGGLNEYDAEIFQDRYSKLIERTIDLAFNHMVCPEYPGIIYLRGGDAISGELHQELRETNDLHSVPAVKCVVEAEAAGITALAERFGRVHVISIAGNHGRTHIKPVSKRYASTNFDTLTAWWLESWFKNDSRVTFWTPDAIDAPFNVYGFDIVLTHGDNIGARGGTGFIGPVANVAKGMRRVMENYATVGKQIHKVLIGHFHTALDLPFGYCNGSLPGFTEYANGLRLRPEPPCQWLLFCHPRYGLNHGWKILLEDLPNLPGQAADLAQQFAA